MAAEQGGPHALSTLSRVHGRVSEGRWCPRTHRRSGRSPGGWAWRGPPAPSAVAEELEGPPLQGSPLGVWGVSPRTHTRAPGPEQ